MSDNKLIEYKVIEDSSDPLLINVESTYTFSFPEAERRAFNLFCDVLDNEDRFNVYALFNNDKYIGFITSWNFDKFTYVEHFAIDESARNGGFGGEAMKQFLKITSNPVVLEVELPEDDMSKRRIGFYERLGFKLDNHSYLQPPFRKGENWLPMFLMSFGSIDLTKDYDTVRNNIYTYVYNV